MLAILLGRRARRGWPSPCDRGGSRRRGDDLPVPERSLDGLLPGLPREEAGADRPGHDRQHLRGGVQGVPALQGCAVARRTLDDRGREPHPRSTERSDAMMFAFVFALVGVAVLGTLNLVAAHS